MKTQSRRNHARFSPVRGFTLMEVLVAMGVFVMVTIGIYTMLFQSYELVRSVRYRDSARAILQSFGDQFLRLATTDTIQGVVTIRPLFQVYTVPTGVGLTWTDPAGATTTGTNQGLPVTLGTLGSGTFTGGSLVTATVTETVRDLDATTGVPLASTVYTAAGYMKMAQFTITYTLGNRVRTQTLTVARSVR